MRRALALAASAAFLVALVLEVAARDARNVTAWVVGGLLALAVRAAVEGLAP